MTEKINHEGVRMKEIGMEMITTTRLCSSLFTKNMYLDQDAQKPYINYSDSIIFTFKVLVTFMSIAINLL